MKKNVVPDYGIPKGLRVYAIGDIHGHLAQLDKLHEAISVDLLTMPPEEVHIVYLGDYIDRGPANRGVIERLIERKARGDGITKSFLKGNHESAVFEFMEDPVGSDWLRYGGLDTLRDYGIFFEGGVPLPAEKERAAKKMCTAVPQEHFEFFSTLEVAVEIGDYLFVHAGVDPRKKFSEQTERDLTCIREPFLSWHLQDDFKPLEKKVVHGHSAYAAPENQPHRVSLDTGCFKGGKLTAGVFEGTSVRFLQA
jgi:serine/threonine protein phosphatase 1